ncbi:acyltransferase [Caballeronia sp. TF1N1]|uniref:acyltransferase family protein n=1 Tax=Caballeronia sp. TF1N1 TaxID=2878153 RepID=UPI001FD12D02|nr:acyltransferase [Caballeronia sp. TF1N1]
MSLYSLLPFVVVLTALCLIFSLPIFKFVDGTKTSGRRVATIDGLRGFLAISVMLYHGIINHSYVTGGGWVAPDVLFYRPLGGVAVMFFFMITAYLFWGRLLKTSGQPNWRGLYVGRFFRIVPLYTFAVIAMIAIVFWRTGWHLHEAPLALIEHMSRWLAFGLSDDMPPVNAFPWTVFILMGVTWSIKYEWWFYFSLIVMALFVKAGLRLTFALIGLAASFALMLTTQSELWCLPAAFFCGIATATLQFEGLVPQRSDRLLSLIAVAAIALLFSFARTHAGVVQIALVGIAFFCIANGASFAGLLRLKSAERLGHISYGIYLLQGLPMTLLFWHEPFRAWATQSSVHYWLALFLCALILCTMASLTYAGLERPFISLGKSLGRARQSSRTINVGQSS